MSIFSFLAGKDRLLVACLLIAPLFSTAPAANAAFIDVCTAGDGCTPDFDVNATASFDATQMKLTITGGVGNIGFAIGQVLDHDGNAFTSANDKINGSGGSAGDLSNLAGVLGFSVLFAEMELNLFLDGSGAVTSGDIRIGSTGVTPAGSWIQDGISGIGLDSVRFNDGGAGIDLSIAQADDDGWLVGDFSNGAGGMGISTDGSLIRIGVQGGDVSSGLLSLFTGGVSVIGDLSLASAGISAGDLLTTSWSGSMNGLNVVVPLPAAWLFFATGLGLLGAFRSRAR